MDNQISKALQEASDSRLAPGAVVGWIKDGKSSITASGHLKYETDSPLVTKDTTYDVASITKSIPVSSLVHIAIQEGKLQLDTRTKDILPELKGKYHDLITIEHLLTYTAIWDIPDGLSHYAKNGSQAVYQTIFESPLIARPGEKYYYTNTPAIVLGMIIEKIYTNTLDSIAQEKLFNPLNMHHATFDATHYPDDTVPPTEKDKHGDVHNIVHDETARALRQSNITSGHAGLFSPVGDILKYCSMILSNGKTDEGKQILSAETIEKFENNYVGSIGESASLGWELNQPRFMGNHSNPKMFGKTGFTGCVVIIDRPKKAAMVILSNAQYPTRHPNRDSINKLRRTIANIIFE